MTRERSRDGSQTGGTDGSGAWSANVTGKMEKLSTIIQITSAGYHTLELFKVDPSRVVDRIVIDTGDLRSSHMGPPESYRH